MHLLAIGRIRLDDFLANISLCWPFSTDPGISAVQGDQTVRNRVGSIEYAGFTCCFAQLNVMCHHSSGGFPISVHLGRRQDPVTWFENLSDPYMSSRIYYVR